MHQSDGDTLGWVKDAETFKSILNEWKVSKASLNGLEVTKETPPRVWVIKQLPNEL